jgi:hypothetical protein
MLPKAKEPMFGKIFHFELRQRLRIPFVNVHRNAPLGRARKIPNRSVLV